MIAESIFKIISPNWITLFDWTSIRVRQTMNAIKEWLGLSSNFPTHTLPLNGEYTEVTREEIWQSGIIIRRASAHVWKILIVTNGQYVDKLAKDLWKYWWFSSQESLPRNVGDSSLGYLWHIHWIQKLVWNIPQGALDIMWNDFGKCFSLCKIAENLGVRLNVDDYAIDLQDYMKERVWYFDERRVKESAFQEFTGINSISNTIITFNPRIEQKDNDIIMTMPTKEEYIAEFTRASSYLVGGDKSFVHPVQWFKYKIGYHNRLFR